jgi:hypothetical protein
MFKDRECAERGAIAGLGFLLDAAPLFGLTPDYTIGFAIGGNGLSI